LPRWRRSPGVTIIHAQQANRAGNVLMWGITGVNKEAALAATRGARDGRRDRGRFEPRPVGWVLPTWVIDAVAEAPAGRIPVVHVGILRIGTTPPTSPGDAISRDRDTFERWIESTSCRAPRWSRVGLGYRPGPPGPSGRRTTTPDDMMIVGRRTCAARPPGVLRRNRAPEHRRQPGPGHPHT